MDTKTLIQAAIKALPDSYVPYSHFHVAAALLCKDQTVYTGINIENAAYSPTICAERSAFVRAKRRCDHRLLSPLRRMQAGNAGILRPGCLSGDFSQICGRVQNLYLKPASSSGLRPGKFVLITYNERGRHIH